MASVKLHTIEELKKMSKEDRLKLLEGTRREQAHLTLQIQARSDKKSDQLKKLKQQVARILTLNRQEHNA